MKLLLPLLLSAIAFAQAPKSDPPFQLPDSVDIKRDVVYATIGDRKLVMDIFLPKSGNGPFPAVVYVHGGGWKNGAKTAFHRHAAHMATKGFIGACIQYRLSGEAKYPAALHDTKAAVRFLRANAKTYRIRPDRIGAAGGSAGGHLVALLALTNSNPAYEGNVGTSGPSSAVQAVAAFNPAVDMVSFGQKAGSNASNSVAEFLGKTYPQDSALYAAASPLAQVHKKSPPFLFLHGDSDTTVPYKQSADMHAALTKLGVPSEIMTAPGAAHGFFNRPPWFEPTLKKMEEFFVRTLGK